MWGYVSGPLYEFEGVHGLVHVIEGGRDVAHDKGKSIAGQGILEKTGQFRLTECCHALHLA